MQDRVNRIFNCHSPWGTQRGYLFRTAAELAQQERIWRTKATFKELGYAPARNAPAELAQFIRDDRSKWQRVAREADLSAK